MKEEIVKAAQNGVTGITIGGSTIGLGQALEALDSILATFATILGIVLTSILILYWWNKFLEVRRERLEGEE